MAELIFWCSVQGYFFAGIAGAPEGPRDGVSRGRDSQELVREKAMTKMARCEGRGYERLSFREADRVGVRKTDEE